MKKKQLTALLMLICLLLGSVSAMADYRYDEFDRTIPAQASFTVQTTWNGRQMGVGAFKQPTDLYVDDAKREIYVLDAGNSRVVILNDAFEALHVVENIHQGDEKFDLTVASGIFVDTDGLIYIADGPNQRVLCLNRDGEVLRVITRPTSGLLADNINFIPRNVIIDGIGIMYIISQDSTQGAYMLDKQGNFLGFYGRNDVAVTADILYQAMLRELATEKQRAGMANFIPVEFANFDVDSEGFIYTVTAYADNRRNFDMIRKLNPLGDNILTNLYRSFGDNAAKNGVYNTAYCDVVVDGDGFIYALDGYNGRVFQYDNEGFQLSILGGKGNQQGYFNTAAAIECLDDRILVLDKGKANITVFEETLFGGLLREGMVVYNSGSLEEAMPYFEELIRMDANFFFAYYVLADAYYELGEYELAEKYAKLTPYASEVYSLAKKELRNAWLRDNFALIFFVVVIGGLLLMFVSRVREEMRKGPRPLTGKEAAR